MPEIQVQDEQGNIHVFPDAATPDMIAKAMGVKSPTPPQPTFSDTLMREVRSAWDTIKSTPSAVLHAAIPSAEAGPLEHAIQWYTDAATGKAGPDPVGQMLNVAPEAVGTAGASVLLGKAAEVAPESAASTANAVRGIAPQLGKTAAVLAKPIGRMALEAATDVPVVRGVLKGVKTFKDVPSQLRDVWNAKQAPALPEPAESVYPEAQQNEPENVEPTALEQAKARFQAAQQQQPSTQTPESYPNGVQKRPTDRAEILDDKAVREQMQKDLGLQGYRGAREVGEENAPAPKWQQVAQAKAQSVIDSAHEQAAQILADAEKAATTPAKLTKTMAPKSAASAAQPIAEDLNSPDRLIDLMQQSIDRLKAAKGK